MTIVILSARSLANSKTKIISTKRFFALAASSLSLALVLGGGISQFISNKISQTPAKTFDPNLISNLEEDNRLLTEHIGKLSARLTQLELKAKTLTVSLEKTQKLKAQMQLDKVNTKQGRLARTQPAAASGGPLLAPRAEIPNADFILSDLLEAASSDEAPESPTIEEPNSPAPAVQEQARMQSQLQTLQAGADRIAAVFSTLDATAQQVSHAHMLFPGRAPIPNPRITSRFGNRRDPFFKVSAFHSGIDFGAPKGTIIHASAGGKVIFAGAHRSYGNMVEISHGAGLVTRYAHSSELLVRAGDSVLPGQPIARVGSTGRSTGPHLHFEILKNGRFINPSVYLSRFQSN